MLLAVQHPQVVSDYLTTCKEVTNEQIVSPLEPVWSLTSQLHVSQFGVVLKKVSQDSWPLIADLSYPEGDSLNDGIPSNYCSLQYASVDLAAERIITAGQAIS